VLCFRLQERYEGRVEASGNAHFVRFGYHAHSAQQFCFDDDVECFPFAWCREIVHLLVGGDDGCSRSRTTGNWIWCSASVGLLSVRMAVTLDG